MRPFTIRAAPVAEQADATPVPSRPSEDRGQVSACRARPVGSSLGVNGRSRGLWAGPDRRGAGEPVSWPGASGAGTGHCQDRTGGANCPASPAARPGEA